MKKSFVKRKESKNLQIIHQIFDLTSLLITHIKLIINDNVVSRCFATPINDTLQSIDDKVKQNIDLFNEVIDAMNNLETDIVAMIALLRCIVILK